jgi:hypothetical protein
MIAKQAAARAPVASSKSAFTKRKNLLGAGQFVGESCIAAAQPLRQATATAIADSEVLRIARKDIDSENWGSSNTTAPSRFTALC